MNHYRKIIICVFRSVGVLTIFAWFTIYGSSLLATPAGVLMLAHAILPSIVPSIVLILAAKPLAKAITSSLTED